MDDNPIIMADAEGVIRFWNAAAEQAFGHLTADAVGRTLDLIVPPDYRDAHWKGFRRAMATAEAAVEGQAGPFAPYRADGVVAEMVGRLTLLRNGAGTAIGAMVVFG